MFTAGWIFHGWVLVNERDGCFYKNAGESVLFSTEESAVKFLETRMYERVLPSLVEAGNIVRVGTLNFSVEETKQMSGFVRFTLRRQGEPFPRVHNQPSNRQMLRWVDGAEKDLNPPEKENKVLDTQEVLGMAKKNRTTFTFNFSQRLWNAIGAPEVPGLEVEHKKRGRGVSTIVTGSATAVKKLAKEFGVYGDGRKGTTGKEYEDRYAAWKLSEEMLGSV